VPTKPNGRPGHGDTVNAASGMACVQALCSCAEPIELMSKRADETNQTLDEIAAKVIERTMRFEG
jgi:hypothetical protein